MNDKLRERVAYKLHKIPKYIQRDIQENCVVIETEESLKIARQYSFPKNFNWGVCNRKKIAEIVTVEEGVLRVAMDAVKESAEYLGLRQNIEAEMEYHNAPDLHKWLCGQGMAVPWHGQIARTYHISTLSLLPFLP